MPKRLSQNMLHVLKEAAGVGGYNANPPMAATVKALERRGYVTAEINWTYDISTARVNITDAGRAALAAAGH